MAKIINPTIKILFIAVLLFMLPIQLMLAMTSTHKEVHERARE